MSRRRRIESVSFFFSNQTLLISRWCDTSAFPHFLGENKEKILPACYHNVLLAGQVAAETIFRYPYVPADVEATGCIVCLPSISLTQKVSRRKVREVCK